jgi:hypothetical protein
MKKLIDTHKIHIKLFFTAFLQVALVALNTWEISHEKYVSGAITSALAAFIWTYNVKKLAFAGTNDRIIYSLGAGAGAYSSFVFIKLLYT